jgi:HPt (histidine-containing phosphotransfer) domain-containing protein
MKDGDKNALRERDLRDFSRSRAVVAQSQECEGAMAQASSSAVIAREQTPMTIDDDHLGRMTLGDRRLEREVLEIFARQTALTLSRIAGSKPATAAAAAHTLKGSALGVGAWRVARAAERLEEAAGAEADDQVMNAAITELQTASLEVCAAIGARLGRHLDEAAAVGGPTRDH